MARAVMSAGAPSLQVASGEKSAGPEWAEGVHVLMVIAKRSVIASLRTDAPAAPGTLALASACLAALAQLLGPYTTGGARNLTNPTNPTNPTNLTNPSHLDPVTDAPATAPEWSVAVLYELLIDRIRPAARLEPPPPSLPAVVAAMAPLWAAMASLPRDASQQPLLSLAIPWLLPPPTPPPPPSLPPPPPLPPAASASPAVVACRLLPLLLCSLVHSPASIPLDQSFAEPLLALCLAGRAAADGASNALAEDLEVTKLEAEAEVRLRALCVFFNKWASAEALDTALATTLAAAKVGDVHALRTWLWLGRAAVCRGGRYASTVPQALVGLLTAPPTALAPSALHSWLLRAADGVGVLMADPAPDLRKASGARTAPLLSQRLYVALAPALRTAFDRTPPDVHAPTTALGAAEMTARLDASSWALLDALTLCLVHAPPATLFAEPTSAVPYLVAWLREAGTELGQEAPTSAAAAAGFPTAVPPTATRWQRLPRVLRLACQLLVLLPPSAAEPLGELLPALTALLRVGEPLSLGAQIETLEAALECLSAACVLPPHCLVPHKKRVLRALMPALDHHKRRVRHAARLCASQWHLTVLFTVGPR